MNSPATMATDLIAVTASDLDLSDIWRLSVEQYYAMAEAGILDEDDPIELLDGYLVTKFRKSPGHVLAKRSLRNAIVTLLPPGWFLGSQDPLTTPDSVPEPDLTVVRGTYRDYATRHPGPGDIAIVVEVADASLHRDQTLKRRIYARAGLAEYWIVNLVERTIEVYTAPSGPGTAPDYADRRDYGADEAVPASRTRATCRCAAWGAGPGPRRT